MAFCETEPIGRDVGFDRANAVPVRRWGLGLIVQKSLPYRSFAEVFWCSPQGKGCIEGVSNDWEFGGSY